jgi:hypothetical protein
VKWDHKFSNTVILLLLAATLSSFLAVDNGLLPDIRSEDFSVEGRRLQPAGIGAGIPIGQAYLKQYHSERHYFWKRLEIVVDTAWPLRRPA